MYLSPSTPTASQPLPSMNGEQGHAGPSRPLPQQQSQWQPTSPYSPMMQPQQQQPTGFYPAHAHNGPSWQSPGRIQQGPRYHEYPLQQQGQGQGVPQGYYPPNQGYYPSYQQQQRPQHTQHPHPSQQAMNHLHYHHVQPQYSMPPVQPQPQPPPPTQTDPTPPSNPPTSSTPLNPAAQGFTFIPRSSPKPAPSQIGDQGPVYASVAHPPSYNPAPIPPHVAMMYSAYPMPIAMGMNPYQQMNPYQYPMPQHYQQQQQPPMMSPVQAPMMPQPVMGVLAAQNGESVVQKLSDEVAGSAEVVEQASSEAQTQTQTPSHVVEEQADAKAVSAAEVKSETQVEKPADIEESKETKEPPAVEATAESSPIKKPTTPQPTAPYTYLSHPSPSSYAYLITPQRPANPTSAPPMSFGTRTTMPKRVKEQATPWKGETAMAQSSKRRPGAGMVFGVGVGAGAGKEEERKVELVFGSVSAEEANMAAGQAQKVAEKSEQTQEKQEVSKPELVEKEVKPKAKKPTAVQEVSKPVPVPTPSAQPIISEPVPPAPTVSSGPAQVSEPQDKPTPAPQAPQPKAKPTSWAALVRPKVVAPPTPAAPAVASASPSPPTPSSSSPETPTEPEAGPSKPNGTAICTSATRPAAAVAAAAPRPVFNYAAAAASGSNTRTPAEEFARLLSEGIYSDQNAKGKGRERTVVVPRGLVNMGNMCFANSILQVLVFCTPFAQLFEELGKSLKADLARRTPLVEAMIIFLREFTVPPAAGPSGGDVRPPKTDTSPFLPSNVYDAMKLNKRFDSMRRGHQEDAEEFLGFFLNTLHEELLLLHARTLPATVNGTKATAFKPEANGDQGEREVERPVSPEADGRDGWLEVGKKQKTNVVRNTESRESAVSRIFGGKLRSILHTPGSKDSVTLEPYQPLQLDIHHPAVLTITDALRLLSEPEIVPGVWSASRNENVDATKQVFIESMPPCLILHVKRFIYDTKEHRASKKSKPIGYGTELVIPTEIMSPTQRTRTGPTYKLFGIVYHHGSTTSGGHYTAAVARPDGSGWLHLDDESIEPVPVEQVIVSREAAMEGKAGEIGMGGREKCAYLAFYQRV